MGNTAAVHSGGELSSFVLGCRAQSWANTGAQAFLSGELLLDSARRGAEQCLEETIHGEARGRSL